VAHVMEQRAKVNACLADMQQARHRSQRSLFLLAVDEGFSLAEIARTWGISRQLVSRMTKEEPGQGSPA
jgi:DNA-directed RNA polymerase specialized sigma24 family protein